MTGRETGAPGERGPAGRGRYHHGGLRDALVETAAGLLGEGGAAGFSMAEASRRLGVAPSAPYRHFADRDELLAAVCTAAMHELAGRMAEGVARVDGERGDPAAAGQRLDAIGVAYLEFAQAEPGLFATAFALPHRHAYGAPADRTGQDRTPLGQLRTVLDELVEAGVLSQDRRDGIEYPIWAAVHGLAVLAGPGPLRDVSDATRRHLEGLTLAFINDALTSASG